MSFRQGGRRLCRAERAARRPRGREALGAAAAKRAATFGWMQTARGHRDVYESLMNPPRKATSPMGPERLTPKSDLLSEACSPPMQSASRPRIHCQGW
jgi:hypothetical protein